MWVSAGCAVTCHLEGDFKAQPKQECSELLIINIHIAAAVQRH